MIEASSLVNSPLLCFAACQLCAQIKWWQSFWCNNLLPDIATKAIDETAGYIRSQARQSDQDSHLHTFKYVNGHPVNIPSKQQTLLY